MRDPLMRREHKRRIRGSFLPLFRTLARETSQLTCLFSLIRFSLASFLFLFTRGRITCVCARDFVPFQRGYARARVAGPLSMAFSTRTGNLTNAERATTAVARKTATPPIATLSSNN